MLYQLFYGYRVFILYFVYGLVTLFKPATLHSTLLHFVVIHVSVRDKDNPSYVTNVFHQPCSNDF